MVTELNANEDPGVDLLGIWPARRSAQLGSEDITRRAANAMLQRQPTYENFSTTAAFLALQLLTFLFYESASQARFFRSAWLEK